MGFEEDWVGRRGDSAARRWVTLLLVVVVALGSALGLVRWQGWRIPYTPWELGGPGVDAAALAALDDLRLRSRRRWWIASGYRSPEHNARVGGVKNSRHVEGEAFDLVVPHRDRGEFYTAAKEAGFSSFGWGNSTVHVDLRRGKWWTYDDEGHHMSGAKRHPYLHKSPENFQRDVGLQRP